MGVTLVGAGCGSPGLLTLAACGAIAGADHIVFDRLIHPDILQLAPGGCSFHQVGKKESMHTLPQEEINSLLVRLGREGGSVVRLKGGDPFIFGRGAEEAEALAEAGVEWAAIPGITSAQGGSVGAGLPLTHRRVCSSLTLATGHRRCDKRPSDSEAGDDDRLLREIAKSTGTVVLYMSASAFAEISRKLLDMGKPPETPVTVVAWGGWGRARRIDGDLSGMNEISLRDGLPSPAVIYIGGSSGIDLKPRNGPLAGMQIAVCRPYPECWETGRTLEGLGADCYGLPLLSIEPLVPDDVEEVGSAVRNADWLVLTSPRGPLELRRVVRDIRRIRGRIVAIGDGTASSLRAIGIEPDHTANGTSESVAELLRVLIKPGESIVFARNERGSHVAGEAARASGASVRSISTYRMAPRQVPGLDVMTEQWESCGLDAVVFGSAAMVEEYARVIGQAPDSTELIAWGSVCADAVQKHLGKNALRLPAPNIDGLIEVLKRLCGNRPGTL
jgi:uroporphyrinogen III methyltransferase/synthase